MQSRSLVRLILFILKYIPVDKKKCVDKYKSTRVWKNIFIQFSLPRINAIKIISMNTLGTVFKRF